MERAIEWDITGKYKFKIKLRNQKCSFLIMRKGGNCKIERSNDSLKVYQGTALM